MSKRKRLFRFLQVSLLVATAGGVWWYENVYTTDTASGDGKPAAAGEEAATSKPQVEPPPEPQSPEVVAAPRPEADTREQRPTPPPATTAEQEAVDTQKVNGYDRLLGTVLVEHRNNDGDSFFVRHGNREFELRLYYADSPEKYLSDRYEDQRRRVAEQARELGGLSIDDTVALGKEARAHVLSLLEGQSFSVFTKWETVYDGDRYYGFVLLPGGTDWLCENLVGNGLARIHTKGETSPDGKAYREFKKHLEDLEAKAKAARRGAWR